MRVEGKKKGNRFLGKEKRESLLSLLPLPHFDSNSATELGSQRSNTVARSCIQAVPRYPVMRFFTNFPSVLLLTQFSL